MAFPCFHGKKDAGRQGWRLSRLELRDWPQQEGQGTSMTDKPNAEGSQGTCRG